MEPEEMAKNVDACYKNILEKFNPGARQLINAGKSYLKALHGAAAAAKIYLESLSRVAKQAQQGTCGGTADIGVAMQQMIDVQREIQSQQLNTLKAFYVDLIVPLESNIEKDTKVVQADHKKFNQQYRSQFDVYSKALTLVKKHSKKSSSKLNRSSASYDKEIKHLQTMEEEKAKLDAFCEQSLKEAIGQERKRYGFVLERQTSLSKHFLAHYGKGAALLEKHLDGWQETSKAREELPACVEFLLGQQNGSGNENLYALPRTPVLTLDDETDNFCSASQMRKSHSIDTSYLYEEAQSTFTEAVNPKINTTQGAGADHGRNNGGGTNLCKSKSEYNLAFASPTRSVRSGFGTTSRPKSLALPGSTKGTVRALYAYLSSGEHQINFLEGDLIQLLGDDPVSFHSNANGDRNKGWYYGENVRTGKRGWFPLAYTEQVKDADVDSGLGLRSQFDSSVIASPMVATTNVDAESTTSGNSSASHSSSSGGPPHTPTSISALKDSCTRKSQSKQQMLHQMQKTATLRPNSLLLGDRPLFNKVPGFSKLRKSRSAFAERLLCPAATPSAPCPAPPAPISTTEHGSAATSATPSSPSPLMTLSLSHSSSTSRILSATTSTTSSPSSATATATAATATAVFSPTKRAPVPPPRLQTTVPPPSVQHLIQNPPSTSLGTNHPLLGMTNAADVSLRSSSDSGFANEPLHQQGQTQEPTPPPAPEVDYSDEESPKFPSNLSHWLLYSSALDVSQDTYDAGWGDRSSRLNEKAGTTASEGLSMTLDRPSKPCSSGPATQNSRRRHQSPIQNKLSSYPPVLGYLATLTRSKASKQLRRQPAAINNNNNNENDLATEEATTEQQQQQQQQQQQPQFGDRSAAVRRLSGLFTKNVNATGQRDPTTMTATKIKNKLSAAPGFLKTALFRSRSKDSFLDVSFHDQNSIETPWQHKSSVPCYVGWRPPMPLPKDCPATEPPRSTNIHRVARTESRRSNLGWRKYVSESDLLDPSESGYMAIDRAPISPSWPPTLALLTPVLGRFEGDSIDALSYSRAIDTSESSVSHTLPRKFQSDWFHSSSPSLRVQFNLEQETLSTATSTGLTKTSSMAKLSAEQRQVKAEFEECSLRLKQRLQQHEASTSRRRSDRLCQSDDQRCEPWYDLWTPDPSVRLCEIAQL